MGYWGKVRKRAWLDTLRALSLDTADRVVVRLLQALVVVGLVWIVLGFTDAAQNVRLLVSSFAVLLALPLIYVWKFIAAPSKLDAELNSQLKVEVDQTRRQQAIDELALEIAWAVNNLINPTPHPTSTGNTEAIFKMLQTKTNNWCARVNSKLADRSVFTTGDQIHFDSLGSVPALTRYGHQQLDWLHSANVLRLERLREIEARARTR